MKNHNKFLRSLDRATLDRLYGPQFQPPPIPVCKACGAELEEWEDYMEGGVCLEDGQRCPNGCYGWAWAYGTTEYHTPVFEGAFYWNAPMAEQEWFQRIYAGAVQQVVRARLE